MYVYVISLCGWMFLLDKIAEEFSKEFSALTFLKYVMMVYC